MPNSAREEAIKFLAEYDTSNEDQTYLRIKAVRLLREFVADPAPGRYDPDDVKTWDDERLLDAIQPLIFTHPNSKARVATQNERFAAELERRGYKRNH